MTASETAGWPGYSRAFSHPNRVSYGLPFAGLIFYGDRESIG